MDSIGLLYIRTPRCAEVLPCAYFVSGASGRAIFGKRELRLSKRGCPGVAQSASTFLEGGVTMKMGIHSATSPGLLVLTRGAKWESGSIPR